MYPMASWKFNKNVSSIFDEHVKQSVPLYEVIQELIAQISDFFIQPNTVIYDIGCSTGESIFKLYQRHQSKNSIFIGIDESEEMLKKAVQKNKNNSHIKFVQESIENYTFEQKSNLILSVLTVQFIPIESRKMVLRAIYEALNTGGAFIFIEKSYPEYPKTQDIFTQIYHDHKELNGLTPLEIREKDKSLRSVLNSLSVTENIELLRGSGFSKIEVFFKYLQFTGFIAIK